MRAVRDMGSVPSLTNVAPVIRNGKGWTVVNLTALEHPIATVEVTQQTLNVSCFDFLPHMYFMFSSLYVF